MALQIKSNQISALNGSKLVDSSVSLSKLSASSVTIGDQTISLGGSQSSFTGLSSVTSTNFSGNLAGNVDGILTGDVMSDDSTVKLVDADNKSVNFINKDTDDLSEGSSNLYHTTARARAAISGVDAGGDGSFSYNSTSGVITYTGPSASEVRAHITEGTGVSITDGEIAIGQAVSTSSNVEFGNMELSGYLRGPENFTIDPEAHGDDTGTVIIKGNLQVDGQTTTINSQTLDVDDLNITVAKGSGSSAAADGAGLTIDIGGDNPELTWDAGNSEFNFNKAVKLDASLEVDSHVSTKGGNLTINNSSNSLKFQVTASNGAVVSQSSIQGTSLTDGTATMSGGALTGLSSVTSTSLTDGTATMTGGTLSGLSSVTSSTFSNHATTATFSVSGAGAIVGSSLTASGAVSFGTLTDSGESIAVTKFVDETDGIGNNDNDTSIPTSAAVKDYVDTQLSDSLDLSNESVGELSDVTLTNSSIRNILMYSDSSSAYVNVSEKRESFNIDMSANNGENQKIQLSNDHDDEFEVLTCVFLNGQRLRYSANDQFTNSDYYFESSNVIEFDSGTLANGDHIEVAYFIKQS